MCLSSTRKSPFGFFIRITLGLSKIEGEALSYFFRISFSLKVFIQVFIRFIPVVLTRFVPLIRICLKLHCVILLCWRIWQFIVLLTNCAPLEREWQNTLVFLPWEPHEQYEKAKRYDTERWTLQVNKCPIPWWLRWLSVCLQCGRPGFDPWVGKFPGEGNGNPLQDYCLENPMDREAW